jgi:hypothetical protein
MKTKNWKRICKEAKADGTLVAIARGIVELNRQGRHGDARVGYKAMADRCQEIDLRVPTGYEGFLLWALVANN